jgi:tetratricopeptide (TPR) repeat protein
MHVVCALLLWRVLEKLGVRGAWLGAALWALHPVQVESVAWITELKNTQSCVFYLLAILCFVKWLETVQSGTERSGKSLYALALLFGLLALLSKTSTVMLPFVFALCWWWKERKLRFRSCVALIPFFTISAIASAWTIWEQKLHSGATGSEWDLNALQRIAIAGKAFWFYLGKLTWPQSLLFIYPRWNLDTQRLVAYLPVALLALLALVLWRHRNLSLRGAWFAFAYLRFLCFRSPVSSISISSAIHSWPIISNTLPQSGPLALAGATLVTLLESRILNRGFLKPAISAVLLLSLGVLTFQQSRIYSSRLTLWRDTVTRNPTAWIAHTNLGAELDDQNRFSEAILQYEESLRLNARDVEAANFLAADLTEMGRAAEAVERLESLLRLQPDHVGTHSNLGIILFQLGRTEDAFAHWKHALQIDPGDVEAHYNFGLALAQDKRFDEAIEHLEEAVRLRPNDVDIQHDLKLVREHSREERD